MKSKAQIKRELQKAETELQDYEDDFWGEDMDVAAHRRIINKIYIFKWVLK